MVTRQQLYRCARAPLPVYHSIREKKDIKIKLNTAHTWGCMHHSNEDGKLSQFLVELLRGLYMNKDVRKYIRIQQQQQLSLLFPSKLG
jgi:hypothetical protein